MKIEVEIPDSMLKFLKALTEFNDLDLEEYVKNAIVFKVLADIKDHEDPLWSPQRILDKYQLETLET